MKTMLFSVVALTAATSFAICTNTLENGASDWCIADSYTDKTFVPGEGDVGGPPGEVFHADDAIEVVHLLGCSPIIP